MRADGCECVTLMRRTWLNRLAASAGSEPALERVRWSLTVRRMAAARVLPMTVADYLAFEESGAVRHEFVAGEIHAMGGASRAHNKISLNLASAFQAGLRGGPCEVFMNDFKVRLESATDEFFYYPDVVVSCHPASIEKFFLSAPTLVVEVLSPSTETIDRREKHTHYRQAPTLEEYVLVAEDRREVTIFRRATGWAGEVLTAPEARVEFRAIAQAMPMAEIYAGVF